VDEQEKQEKEQQKKPNHRNLKTSGTNYGILKRHKIRNKPKNFIAYDLETTPIEEGTPTPTYITAYGEDFYISEKLESIHHLKAVLITDFLTNKNKTRPFIAWNANRFDAYFIAMALLTLGDEYLLRPYLTKGHSLRGLGVIEFPNDKTPATHGYQLDWQFLDGMAMTGAQIKLKHFLKTFAPDHQKLDIGLSTGTIFDPDNKTHQDYAMRDSVGLYHAMNKCNDIVKQTTGYTLTTTIGNLGIKYFQSQFPENVESYMPPPDAREAIYDHVMRGGYCYCAYKHDGPIWKYDINQAYAAAMRDAPLPAGNCARIDRHIKNKPAIYLINATRPTSIPVPFYYKPTDTGKGVYTFNNIVNGWITSTEYDQLKNENWEIEILDGYCWAYNFNMCVMVNKLEKLRHSDPLGPKGPIGTVAKFIGNNSYGKLCEQLWGEELVMALEQPDGFIQYRAEDENYGKIWVKIGDPQNRAYHRPQIAAFITAHVRMEVRRAALLGGEHWVYADTDCVAYTQPITGLNIHPTKYGAWKQETNGEHYRIITKKVYASADGKIKHAKGMRVKPLTKEDFKKWYDGEPPEQIQLQCRNLLHVLSGFDMYVTRTKVGQRL
jgi:hypothetical protein